MAKIRHGVPLDVHLILKKENKVLLLKRCKTGYADGQYALVAGCQESHESITAAAIREAKEEVGVDLHPEQLKMSCVMHLKLTPPGERIGFFFTVTEWGGKITNCEPHKHDDVRFFSIDQLPDTLIPWVKTGLCASLSGQHFVEVFDHLS